MTKRTPAADQFAKLGLAPDVWTEAMQLAVKQRWSGLPVDKTVGQLRTMLTEVAVAPTATADELLASGEVVSTGKSPEVAQADAAAEAARLVRNAKVNAWRERKQILAALEARELKFAQMRAGKKAAPATEVPAPAAGDAVSALANA